MRRSFLITGLILFALIAEARSTEDRDASAAAAGDNSARIGLRYQDPAATEFLKAVLESMKLAYTVETEADGAVVLWHSAGAQQEKEIRRRVSQYMFVRDVCEERPAPSPYDSAKDIMICRH